MTQVPAAVFKIPTESPQLGRGKAARPLGGQAKTGRSARSAPGLVRASGTGRAATRGGGEVVELEHG
ncbi:MAG TPA: hypothetical protein VH307_18930, partial [Streptosporangiaceae bacterium]|nr:hypothetical protein [Streptosporangiaceae bacterium]